MRGDTYPKYDFFLWLPLGIHPASLYKQFLFVRRRVSQPFQPKKIQQNTKR